MSLSCRTLALIFRNIFLIHGQVIKHQHTHPKCATGNQSRSRVLHCLHCRSSEGNLGDDLRLGRRASC